MLTLQFGIHTKKGCLCIVRNGKRFQHSACEVHVPPTRPKIIFVRPTEINTHVPRKLLTIKNKRGKRDDFCKSCTFDRDGCITYLSFDCDVHAPQTGRL